MNASEFYDAIRENIRRTGLHIQGVFGGGDNPGFTYTIGLHEKLGYELIVFGIPFEAAAHVMNEISLRETPLELDVPDKDYFNLPVMFRRCEWEKVVDYAVQAFEFYGEGDIPFVQIVLCDKEGKFPEDMAFDHAYMDDKQPLLYKVAQ